MSKCINLVTNFQKVQALRPQRFLTFDFGNPKLCDLPKLCFFKLIMTKSNMKRIVVTLSLLRHQNNTKLTSQDFSTLGSYQSKLLAMPMLKS